MIKIGISGILGKMGKRILDLAKQDSNLQVVFGLEKEDCSDLAKSIEGVKVEKDAKVIKSCDCLIEFTSPQATMEHLSYLKEFKKPAVIGTTGLNNEQQDEIKQASKSIPIVFSPNMSIGVNLLFELIKTASRILKGYDVSVEEVHHIHKKDSPSGTAKKIAQIINDEGFGLMTSDIKAQRVDEVVGDHKVIFTSTVDRLELSHSAKTRDIFAEGALRACKWLVSTGSPSGLYSMEEVLGLK